MPLILHGIGTAVPSRRLSQADAVQVAHRINAETPEQARLMTRIYQKTKVLSRGSVLLEKDEDDATIQERLRFYGADSPSTAEFTAMLNSEGEMLPIPSLFAKK